LQAAGLQPNDLVEIVAVDNSIVIKRAGDRRPPLPNPSSKSAVMDSLMAMSVEQRPVDPRKDMADSSDDERPDLFARVD